MAKEVDGKFLKSTQMQSVHSHLNESKAHLFYYVHRYYYGPKTIDDKRVHHSQLFHFH